MDKDPANLSFRSLFSEVTSVLVRRFGTRHWETIEDSVQTALAEAVLAWPRNPPDDPSAWVYRAAFRRLVDFFRRDRALIRAYAQIAQEESILRTLPDLEEIHDETLRMLFLCCSPSLTEEGRVALALKSVSGFSMREIASAFMTSEETIKKRIQRARAILREQPSLLLQSEVPPDATRVESVRKVVYLILNEGSSSSLMDQVVRDDLIGEALRLSSLLAHAPLTSGPASHALCSLVLFHAARFSQRQTDQGIPISLRNQDRSAWDQSLIAQGEFHLHQALESLERTPYHYEAMIAWHHCRAKDFASTDWGSIVSLYEKLLTANSSPAAHMAWAIALSYRDGPAAGIEELQKRSDLFSDDDAHYFAALADFSMRIPNVDSAMGYLNQAIQHAKADWLKQWLRTRIDEVFIEK